MRSQDVGVTLVQPSCTKTSLEANSPQAATLINAYDAERQRVTRSFSTHVNGGDDPTSPLGSKADVGTAKAQ